MTMQGYKTYIVAVLMGALSTAHMLGYVDDGTYQAILGLLSAIGLGTLRAGVTKSGPQAGGGI